MRETLEDELAAQRAIAAARRDVEERRIRAAAIDDVAASGLLDGAIGVGSRLPPVVLPDLNGRIVDVQQLLTGGPVVLMFFRGGWCPYCNIALRAMERRAPEYRALDATVIAITPELPDRSAGTATTNGITIPILFDADNHAARHFGIVHAIDPAVVGYQLRNGNDVAKFNGAATAEVPLPATFVVGCDGVITYAFIDADYTRRADPDAILDAVRRLRTT